MNEEYVKSKSFGILIFYCILLLGVSSLVCFTLLFEKKTLPTTDIGKRMKIISESPISLIELNNTTLYVYISSCFLRN